MPSAKVDRRARLSSAVARRDGELIARAAKRTNWAAAVLESAAGDLDASHGDDGNPLTGVAEVVLEQAARLRHLAEDIESHRRVPEDAAKLRRGLG